MSSSNTFSKLNIREKTSNETNRSSKATSLRRSSISRGSQNSANTIGLQTKISNLAKVESNLSSDSTQSLIDYYRYEIKKSLEIKQYKQALEYCKKYKELILASSDHSGLQNAFKIQGNIYLHLEDLKNALISYRNLKGIAEYNCDYLDKILAYQKIGNCYKLLKHYKLALTNYKKMLQLSWDIKSMKYELLAYDFIGMQYYYLGDIERARYYHERMWRGISEDVKSPVRKISQQNLKLKRKSRLQEIYPQLNKQNRSSMSRLATSSHIAREMGQYASYISGDEDESDLPSPRGISSISDVRLLPHYKPKHSEVFKADTARKSASNIKQRKIEPKRSSSVLRNSLSKSKQREEARPFILLSHLSPIECFKNYYYVDQMQTLKTKEMMMAK